MNHITPSDEQYVALCLAFAGRFQQLFYATNSATERELHLRAAAFAIDRSTPDPEIHVKVRQGNIKDPVTFLVASRALVEPTPLADWRKRPTPLRNSLIATHLDALDLVLLGDPKAKKRGAFLLEWLAPYLDACPEIGTIVRDYFTEATAQKA